MAHDRRLTAAFVLEQHLGHKTYAQNLATHIDDQLVEPHWIPVTYEPLSGVLRRLKVPRSICAALAGRRQVRRGLGETSADVYVFNTQVPAALGGRAARTHPTVVITDVTPVQYDRVGDTYGHEPDRFALVRWLKHRQNVKVMRHATSCVGWSNWAAASFIDDYGVDAARVEVIPPGVDLERWRPGPARRSGPVRLLFVGGDFERKGGRELLAAFERLEHPAELTIVTKSDVKERDGVTVIRDLAPNDGRLVELYRSSDVFVMPTLGETFGIAAIEAAASGLAVVATAVGGLPDIVVDGQTGLLVEPGDIDQLSDALASMVSNDDLRRSFGARGRKHADEHFDAATNARRLGDLICRAGQQ